MNTERDIDNLDTGHIQSVRSEMNILIVDDHELVRVGLCYLVEETFPGCVIYEASDAAEGYVLIQSDIEFDLVLLDIILPDMNGFQVLSAIKEIKPDLPVIAITGYSSSEYAEKAHALGAAAYLSKKSDVSVIKGMLKLISAGNYQLKYNGNVEISNENSSQNQIESVKLSRRQKEVLKLVCDGKSNKRIANTLYVAEGTVKNHIASIFEILQVTNRTEAAMQVTKFSLL